MVTKRDLLEIGSVANGNSNEKYKNECVASGCIVVRHVLAPRCLTSHVLMSRTLKDDDGDDRVFQLQFDSRIFGRGNIHGTGRRNSNG